MRVFVGVDPGKGGGVAVLSAGGAVVAACKMPESGLAILDKFGNVAKRFDAVAAVEHVWSMPGQGHGGAFAFGRSVERVQMGLFAAGIPFALVIPRKWQAALGIKYPKGSTDVEKKNITKARAGKLFPRVEVTHAIADALLIAEWCRRHNLGTNKRKG